MDCESIPLATACTKSSSWMLTSPACHCHHRWKSKQVDSCVSTTNNDFMKGVDWIADCGNLLMDRLWMELSVLLDRSVSSGWELVFWNIWHLFWRFQCDLSTLRHCSMLWVRMEAINLMDWKSLNVGTYHPFVKIYVWFMVYGMISCNLVITNEISKADKNGQVPREWESGNWFGGDFATKLQYHERASRCRLQCIS